MACFLVPTGEAIVTTITKKVIEKHEVETSDAKESKKIDEIRFSEKLGWLNKMLWGGSGLLAFEHLWHGEISPYFPFLTAASNVKDATEMLHEMATSGTAMAVLVTVAWGVLVAVTDKIRKNAQEPDKVQEVDAV